MNVKPKSNWTYSQCNAKTYGLHATCMGAEHPKHRPFPYKFP